MFNEGIRGAIMRFKGFLAFDNKPSLSVHVPMRSV